jgi:DNA-directed RNA polymerase specialized sigma24 family protein
MADGASTGVDIELLIYRMAEQEQDALVQFLATCGGKIKGYLKKNYGDVLNAEEIDEAVNTAAFNIWTFADRYRTDKGTPKAWVIRIARNAAVSILRGENRNRAKDLEYNLAYDPGDYCDEDTPAAVSRDLWRVQQMQQIIDKELKGLEQAVAKADVAAGGSAEAGRLAALHGTSKGTIYATRTKVRSKIRKLILEREARTDSPRGRS